MALAVPTPPTIAFCQTNRNTSGPGASLLARVLGAPRLTVFNAALHERTALAEARRQQLRYPLRLSIAPEASPLANNPLRTMYGPDHSVA